MKYKQQNTVLYLHRSWMQDEMQFCASTLDGLARNLSPRYSGQIYTIQRITGYRVSNIVLMGQGEPLSVMRMLNFWN